MYKQLFIIRHGKSSWDYEQIRDIDRTLKQRGIIDGYLMAERLLSKQLIPQKIMVSPANRALHSATIIARVLGIPYPALEIVEELYFSDENTILQRIGQTSKSIDSLMVIGHNPVLTDLGNHFLNHSIDNIPTTGIVWLKFETADWLSINPKNLVDYFFDYPKNKP
ncbi:MAG: histidine phosphatase family protein [Bacteroidales bacterium]|jgi:phosphohistidine phosphatase|nr:histidine phosphatase family protein [Bacteroidales bacterium]